MTADDHQRRFKDAARRFASGVTVVTTRHRRRVHGITASSFSSLSVDPLLVAVSVDHRSRLIELVEAAQVFAISVLGRSQHHLARHFATPGREPLIDDFDVVASYPVATGAPILVGGIAHFDCRLHSMLPGGDHRILIGSVVAAGESDGEPLLYFEGDYHELGDPSLTTDAETASGIDEADLLAVQRVVEPKIAALAATAATAHDLGRLRSLLRAAAAVADHPRRFTELSLEFHVALAEASGSRGLRALATSLRADQQFAYEARTDLARARHVLAEHQAILDLVEAGDAAGARTAMHKHILDMQDHFCPKDTAHGGFTEIRRTSIPDSTSGSTASPA